jgi:hypothetical protein
MLGWQHTPNTWRAGLASFLRPGPLPLGARRRIRFSRRGQQPALRTLALVRAPLAFKRRNLFTHAVDLPLALRAGRPAKSAEEKRRANAERQRRFRETRRAELAALRQQVRGTRRRAARNRQPTSSGSV